jgi:Ca2+-binding RTX toxin-like protein
MFLSLNAALLDHGIATWDAKYAYDFVRPQSAIRYLYEGEQVEAWVGPDLGTGTIDGADWRPYQDVTFVTPPFPEFTSGHSAFSLAAALTLSAFLGDDTYYDGETLGNYDLDSVPGRDLIGLYETDELAFETFPAGEDAVALRWDTLLDAAAEARWRALFGEEVGGTLYAGFSDDVLIGRGGDDVLKPGPGSDAITTGGGADTVRGTAAELDGNTVTDISPNDAIFAEGALPEAGAVVWDASTGVLSKGDAELTVAGLGPMARPSFAAMPGGTEIRFADPVFRGIEGDGGIDRLRGTAAEEVIASGGGRIDVLSGGENADVFVFSDAEGARDRMRVLDFDADEDALFLDGASIAQVRAVGTMLRLELEQDRDSVTLRGVADLAELRILDAAEFDALTIL